MNKKEARALREWVKDGNSVYENPAMAWQDGQIPVEFVTVWRDEQYIRQQTKGMCPEEARQFALAYYGWDESEACSDASPASCYDFAATSVTDDIELPFS